MRRPSPRKPGPVVRLARILLASLLACAVLAGSAPAGLASDAHGCSMPCCQGAGGDCGDGSCAVDLPLKAEAPAPAPESDPMCGAAPAAPARGHGAAAHHAPAAAPTHHPPPARDADADVVVEYRHRRHVSARNTLPGASSVAASVSEPCPPDCGAAPNNSNSPRPTRQQAALAAKPRPRAPAHAARSLAPSFAAASSAALRRACPPRAPPAPDADSAA